VPLVLVASCLLPLLLLLLLLLLGTEGVPRCCAVLLLSAVAPAARLLRGVAQADTGPATAWQRECSGCAASKGPYVYVQLLHVPVALRQCCGCASQARSHRWHCSWSVRARSAQALPDYCIPAVFVGSLTSGACCSSACVAATHRQLQLGHAAAPCLQANLSAEVHQPFFSIIKPVRYFCLQNVLLSVW
jgi:hypothetical protein